MFRSYIHAVCFVSCLISFASCTHQEHADRPNIILINIDDLGWRDVGFMGSEYYETPNIDKLASQSMVFLDAYASASNCAPSRACMMSGQWTPRHGIYTVESSERGKSADRKLVPTPNTTTIPDNNYLLPQALHDAGFRTCHAGKWHLSESPLDKGFDVNIGGNHSGNPGSYYPPYKSVPELQAPVDDYNLTVLIMDKTLDFLSADSKQPFFLYYAPYAVHTPIQPIKELLPKYENKKAYKGQNNAKYATMVENVDRQIGRLISKLEENGKLENTFILFTSDNGGVYKITKQRPLRAGKGAYYEGGIRVPLFAYWKGKIKNGESDVPVSNLDFYPTILEVARIDKPNNKQLDGVSLLPIINGTTSNRNLYWHFPIYLEGGNDETQDPLFRTRPGSAIRSGDWKLIQYFENNDIELYNLKDDPSEKQNLAKSMPEKAEELLNSLLQWRESTNAPVPTKLNL
ncbi:MAG: sulfatase [Bacteroidales bacterium]